MKYTYEEIITESFTGENKILKRTDENGTVWWIPLDPANSDYQAYLNPVEDSTEILPSE
jgi:hypothetical protein